MARSFQYDARSIDEIGQILGGELVRIEQNYKNADFTKEMQGFLSTLATTHEGYFDRDAGPSGDKWPALKPYTIAKKGHDTILEETRAMKRSVAEAGGSNAIRSATHRGLVFGTSDEKAIFHQYGTRRIPKREFVGMNEALVDNFVNQIADAAVEKMLA